jgi:hypothetical protein
MAVAGAMAQLDLAVAGAGDQVVYDFAHPVAQLFNKRPNPLWSAAVYKLLIFLQMELVGQHFSYADRGPTGEGEISEIWPIFDPVELVVDDRTDPLKPALLGGRVLHNQGAAGLSTSVNGMTPLLPSELLWLRYPDPADPWGCLPRCAPRPGRRTSTTTPGCGRRGSSATAARRPGWSTWATSPTSSSPR